MIEFTSGNMFDGKYDVMVNTVNCVGVMGKGVALEFKGRFPDMFLAYKTACAKGEVVPGKLHVWDDLFVTVVNLPTKRHWRDPSRYEDVNEGLVALKEYLMARGTATVALPPPGCGNGGLDWKIVRAMVIVHLSNLEAKITVFKPQEK
jgi:O-acetyl-ADP-ribose deacetylase (regulator of RNase III)